MLKILSHVTENPDFFFECCGMIGMWEDKGLKVPNIGLLGALCINVFHLPSL